MPDRLFHNFGASKPVDWQTLCSSETSCDGFWNSISVKGSVGWCSSFSCYCFPLLKWDIFSKIINVRFFLYNCFCKIWLCLSFPICWSTTDSWNCIMNKHRSESTGCKCPRSQISSASRGRDSTPLKSHSFPRYSKKTVCVLSSSLKRLY